MTTSGDPNTDPAVNDSFKEILDRIDSIDKSISKIDTKSSKSSSRSTAVITLVTSLCAIGVSLYSIWQTTQNEMKKSREERFLKAAELISNKDNVNARLAGISALAALIDEPNASEKQWHIVRLLSSSINSSSALKDKNGTVIPRKPDEEATSDVKSAILVIKNRDPKNDEKLSKNIKDNIDLRLVNLHGADLEKGNFDKTDFSGSNLHGTAMDGANLNNSYFRGTNLIGAGLRGAQLKGSDLTGADLTKAQLTKADSSGKANLNRANLNRANLTGTNLTNAILTEADLTGANLKTHQDSTQADLTGTEGLTYEQLEKSCYANQAKGLSDETKSKLDDLEKNNPSEKREECNNWGEKKAEKQPSQKQKSKK